VFVRRITDRDGKVLAEFGSDAAQRVMTAASAATLTDMMRGVINRGTGTAVRYRYGINGDVAGKTGTTQNNADGWFILMHPNLVAGAWVGFNDNRVTMRSNYWGQGGHNAILVVGNFFKSALDSGKINGAAVFPGGRRPEPPRHADEEFEEMEEMPGDLVPQGVELEEGVTLPPPEPESRELAIPEPPPAPDEEEAVEVEPVPEGEEAGAMPERFPAL
jgi:penicillin-binding protein 1A